MNFTYDICWFGRSVTGVMSQKPCRQLNSVAIRDEVLASIIPIVRSSCSVIGVKCVWRVQGGPYGIRSAWSHIVAKRNECDAVIVKTPGVCFFFSAISTYQSKNSKTSTEEFQSPRASSSEEEEENEVIENLKRAMDSACAEYNVGKVKMLEDLIQQFKQDHQAFRQRMAEEKRRKHEERREDLRCIGVNEDLLYLLPSDPLSSVPMQLQQEVDARRADQKKVQNEREVARIKDLFTSQWLINKEREMVDLQLQIQNCPAGAVRKAKEYLLSTCVDALKAFHVQKKTPLALGLQCRREILMDNGLLKTSRSYLVHSLQDPVHLTQTGSEDNEEQDSGEEEIFMTPPRNVSELSSKRRQVHEKESGVKRPKMDDNDEQFTL